MLLRSALPLTALLLSPKVRRILTSQTHGIGSSMAVSPPSKTRRAVAHAGPSPQSAAWRAPTSSSMVVSRPTLSSSSSTVQATSRTTAAVEACPLTPSSTSTMLVVSALRKPILTTLRTEIARSTQRPSLCPWVMPLTSLKVMKLS